jgi:hypothetical protein
VDNDEGGGLPIMSSSAAALAHLCPDLDTWPESWRYDDADIATGKRIVQCFTSFLTRLLEQPLAMKTLRRHRDHLWMLGGEIIRRVHDEPVLRHQPINTIILQLGDEECGPLIWPRITEPQQNAFDATYRKLYQFLSNQNPSQ